MIRLLTLTLLLTLLFLLDVIPGISSLIIKAVTDDYHGLVIKINPFGAAIILLFLGTTIVWLHRRLIQEPVKKLKRGFLRLSRGEFGRCGSLPPFWGWGRLADAFNTMAKNLEETRERQLLYLEELEQDNRFHSLLSQKIIMMQGCRSQREVHAILGRFLSQFFPGDSGAFLTTAAHDLVESVVVWGQSAPGSMAIQDCPALLQGQIHCGPPCSSFGCQHLQAPSQDRICVPVRTTAKLLGLLQLVLSPDPAAQGNGQQLNQKKKWAINLAEHVGLVLTNIMTQEKLRNLSLRDPLTGLFNRRFLEEALDREIYVAARHDRPLAVIMLDLDLFKNLNDAYGHAAGDALLKELGLMLRQNIRGGDIACRYGGEEFILILPEANMANAWKRAEEIRLAIQNLRVWHNFQWLSGLTLSAGVAVYPEHGATRHGLLKAADLALYQTKALGRNRVVMAGGEQQAETQCPAGSAAKSKFAEPALTPLLPEITLLDPQ